MNIDVSKIVIRKIELKDVALLVEYRMRYLTELQGEPLVNNTEASRLGLEKYFVDAISGKRFFAFVAETAGVVVGFGGMVVKKIPGDFTSSTYLEGDILNMYTIPAARRKGISQLILNALLNEAKLLGISKVALHTSKDGEHLYRKNGFSEPVYPYFERVIGTVELKHE